MFQFSAFEGARSTKMTCIGYTNEIPLPKLKYDKNMLIIQCFYAL